MTVSSNWRTFAGVASGVFFAYTITWLLMYGKPENSLHASALSWSFTGFIGLLVSVGFTAAATIVLPKVGTAKP